MKRCWLVCPFTHFLPCTAVTLNSSGMDDNKFIWLSYCNYYGVVPCKASHALRPFPDLLCVPIWVLIIPHSSTRDFFAAETLSSEAGRKLARNVREFCRRSISVILRRNLLTCRKILRHGTDGFTSLRRKSSYGFLSSLKLCRPRPGLNLRTLGPVARTIATRPPTTTGE
jgi:hypothetical protein